MTRAELAALAAASLERFDPADIDRPIADTGLDSLDMMTLRSAIESALGHDLRDELWFGSASLAELLGKLDAAGG